MDSPLVSVIIPNYNYENYLPEALDSVLAQTYANIEIIVVDDGSSDGSRDVIEAYGSRIRSIFQKNQGVSAARNNGAGESRGTFLAFLDADDLWLPQKVEKQVELFLRDPDLGLVHVAVDEIDSSGASVRRHTAGLHGMVADRLVLLTLESIYGGGSGLMVPKKVFEEVGGFDLRLSTSADWDLFFQISSRYPVGFVPEILLKYRFHDSNMHSNVGAMEHDMCIAFEKAFRQPTPELAKVKRRAYGILNRTLAASYLRAGKYGDFLRTGVKSIASYPPIIFSKYGA